MSASPGQQNALANMSGILLTAMDRRSRENLARFRTGFAVAIVSNL
jgi:hypothetical protein